MSSSLPSSSSPPPVLPPPASSAPQSSPISFRHRLELYGLNVAGWIFRLLGADVASAFSGFVWSLLAPFNTRRYQRAKAQILAAYPELSEKERGAILHSVWDNLGRTMAEIFLFEKILPQKTRFIFDDTLINAVERAKKGSVIFTSMHFGNWEFGFASLIHLGLKTSFVYQKVQNPLIEKKLHQWRLALYPGGLFRKGDRASSKMRQLAQAGGTVCILADLRDHNGVESLFFGRPAPSPISSLKLAREQNIPLFVLACFREKGVYFRIKACEIPVICSDNAEEDIKQMSQTLQSQFETLIREQPGLWMWGHRRWG